MSDNPNVDEGLRRLGIDPDDVDPAVLVSLRKAATKPPRQLSRDDLARMSPAEITEAEAAGKLDHLLGRKAD